MQVGERWIRAEGRNDTQPTQLFPRAFKRHKSRRVSGQQSCSLWSWRKPQTDDAPFLGAHFQRRRDTRLERVGAAFEAERGSEGGVVQTRASRRRSDKRERVATGEPASAQPGIVAGRGEARSPRSAASAPFAGSFLPHGRRLTGHSRETPASGRPWPCAPPVAARAAAINCARDTRLSSPRTLQIAAAQTPRPLFPRAI